MKPVESSTMPPPPLPPLSYQIKPKSSRKGNDIYYAITHININIRDRLIKLLNNFFSEKLYGYEILINSILIRCGTEEELDYIKQTVKRNEKELHTYGHNGYIVYGETTGHLCIYNYQEKLRKDLQQYVCGIMSKRVLGWEFKKDNHDKSRSCLDLKMDPRDAASALDELLKDEELRGFRLKGNPGDTPKMKVMLKCNNS